MNSQTFSSFTHDPSYQPSLVRFHNVCRSRSIAQSTSLSPSIHLASLFSLPPPPARSATSHPVSLPSVSTHPALYSYSRVFGQSQISLRLFLPIVNRLQKGIKNIWTSRRHTSRKLARQSPDFTQKKKKKKNSVLPSASPEVTFQLP